MSTAQIWAAGQQRLARIETEAEGINTWKAYLANYRPRAKHADDACVWLTCVLALEAVNAGNNGIGSILVDSVGRVVAWLRTEGLAESTMVVYMGDNGFAFGEHGLIDKRTAHRRSC